MIASTRFPRPGKSLVRLQHRHLAIGIRNEGPPQLTGFTVDHLRTTPHDVHGLFAAIPRHPSTDTDTTGQESTRRSNREVSPSCFGICQSTRRIAPPRNEALLRSCGSRGSATVPGNDGLTAFSRLLRHSGGVPPASCWSNANKPSCKAEQLIMPSSNVFCPSVVRSSFLRTRKSMAFFAES